MQERVRAIYRLIQILQSPFSNGHALLIMEGSPDVSPMLFRQLTDLLQVELFTVNPSAVAHDRDYDIGMFKSDLVSCLIRAGIKVNKHGFHIFIHLSCTYSVLQYVIVKKLTLGFCYS